MHFKKKNFKSVIIDLFNEEKYLKSAIKKIKPDFLITKSEKFSSLNVITPISYFNSEEFLNIETDSISENENLINELFNFSFIDNVCVEASIACFNEHNLKIIRSYLYVIDKLISESSANLLFFIPLSSNSSKVFLYEAEGETQIQKNKFIYRKSDYLPTIIGSFLKDANQKHKFLNTEKKFFQI